MRTPQRPLLQLGRLDRYVGTLFFSSYATALLLMMGLFIILDMASNLDDYLEPWPNGETVGISVVVRYYILNLPYQFLQIAPFVTVLSAMFTVNRMLKKNEVSAVLAAGISAHRMLLPIFASGALLTVTMFGIREVVGAGIADHRDKLLHVLDDKSYERIYNDIYVDDLSRSHVRLGEFYPDRPGSPIKGMTAVLRKKEQLLHIDAAEAIWEDGAWRLEQGVRTIVDESRLVEEVEVLEGFEFTPELALTYRRARENPLELSFSEVQDLMRRDPDDVAYQTLWHYNLTFPLANLVLLLVGIPVMFVYERGRGTERMALGGLLCVFYFCVDFVFRSLGLGGGLSPVLASWLPLLLFGSLGVVLYDSMRT